MQRAELWFACAWLWIGCSPGTARLVAPDAGAGRGAAGASAGSSAAAHCGGVGGRVEAAAARRPAAQPPPGVVQPRAGLSPAALRGKAAVPKRVGPVAAV